MMTKIFFTVFIFFVATSAGFAYEMRTWSLQDGTQVKGRFYREMFGKLTVESEDGTRTVLAITDLSDLDKKYVRVMIPPKIEVQSRTSKTVLEPRPAFYKSDDIETVVQVKVEIQKKSQRPFTSRLNAEIFLVADEVEGDNYILLSRSEGDFLLLEENDFMHVFRSEKYKTVDFRDVMTGLRKGEEYNGHVLLITSMQGDLVMTDSNLPGWMQEPEILEKLGELSLRGASSVRSRHFNKNGDQVPPPRIPDRPASVN